jgi:phage terminase large subunit
LARIRLPANDWRPRDYQLPLWNYLEAGGKRAIEIAHRRWGKDDVALHRAACAAHERIGTYWHMLPEYEQARKAIWAAVNPHTGRRRIDEAFPLGLRANTNEQSMFIRFRNGSTWQVIGSDNYEKLVGTPPLGIVFSEWARANPGAWAYLAPILAENGGWAAFITTPIGRNHAKKLLDLAKADPAHWFAEVQTVEDTKAISLQVVEQQRAEYHALYGEEAGDALIEQEYWCSFTAAVLGAYWGKVLAAADREGRICKVDVVPGYPINTAWDIGVDDPMAIWIYQVGPGWLNVIDYYESSGFGFDHYVDWLNERGYKGGIDWVPHDAKMREVGAPGARTRIQTLILLGRNPQLVPDHKPMDGVNAARKTIPLAKFDATRCAKGLECLREYKAEWDPDLRTFRKKALHNWASHGADAWRHLSVAWTYPHQRPEKKDEPMRGAEQMTVNELLRSMAPRRVRI